VKFKQNQKYNTIAIYALGVIVAALLIFMFFGHIGDIIAFAARIVRHLMAVVYGIVFAFLLSPLLKLFEKHLLPRVFSKTKIKPGANRAIAMVLTYLVTFSLIALVLAIVIPEIINSITGIWGQVPLFRRTLNDWYLSANAYIAQFSAGGADGDVFAVFLADMVESLWSSANLLMERSFDLVNDSLASLVVAATTITTGVITIVLGIVISIYILKDKKRIFAQLNKTAIALFSKRAYLLIYDTAKDISRIFSGFVTGRTIDSLIIGVICAIVMPIIGIEHVALITVIIAITNFVPIFGPIIGAIPSILILLTVDYMMALRFGVFILILQQLEGNIIGPKITGDIIGLPPIMVIISLVLFAGLWGFLGMLIGVPVFTVLYSIVRRFTSYLLAKKGYPTATMEYTVERNPLINEPAEPDLLPEAEEG